MNLLEKVGGLEAQDEYRKLRQNSDRQDANRRPQYNSQGDRTDRTRRDSMRVRYVQYADGSSCDSENTVRRMDGQKRARQFWLGGSKKEEDVAVRQTTAAYL
jgi:hypothetical protein